MIAPTEPANAFKSPYKATKHPAAEPRISVAAAAVHARRMICTSPPRIFHERRTGRTVSYPGQESGRSRSRGQLHLRPNLRECGTVLGTVKAWPASAWHQSLVSAASASRTTIQPPAAKRAQIVAAVKPKATDSGKHHGGPQHLNNRTRLARAEIFAYGPDSDVSTSPSIKSVRRLAE